MAAVPQAWPIGSGGWPEQPPDADATDPPPEGAADDSDSLPEGFEPI